jgi:signal transduction histidine kinase
VFPNRLIRTTSFRLAAIYLVLFALSTLALGIMVYASVRHEIMADFDDRIAEEADALQSVFSDQGRDRLAKLIDARGSGGGALAYGLEGPKGERLVGNLSLPRRLAESRQGGWVEMPEAESDEPPETKPEVIRAYVSRLSDGSTLIVGDELRRVDDALRGVMTAFGWAVGVMIVLGAAGGLWLSAQFLRRIDAMRLAALGIMGGQWSRRIPLSPVDDDLSALARTFNRLFDRIEKLLLANKHVSADIAHDLRKPLAGILRRLEAARREGASPATIREAIDAAIVEIESVLEMFSALLRIGQIEAGARLAAFQPLDLAGIARNAVEAFQPAAEEQGKTLVQHLGTELPMSGDKELLTQMVANLLDNALRHTPAGARIEVVGVRTRGGVSLSVADNGAGVAPEDLTAIFERFYRADSARALPGSGLGLSLVAAIAELHSLDCSASDNHPGLRVTLATSPEDEG